MPRGQLKRNKRRRKLAQLGLPTRARGTGTRLPGAINAERLGRPDPEDHIPWYLRRRK